MKLIFKNNKKFITNIIDIVLLIIILLIILSIYAPAKLPPEVSGKIVQALGQITDKFKNPLVGDWQYDFEKFSEIEKQLLLRMLSFSIIDFNYKFTDHEALMTLKILSNTPYYIFQTMNDNIFICISDNKNCYYSSLIEKNMLSIKDDKLNNLLTLNFDKYSALFFQDNKETNNPLLGRWKTIYSHDNDFIKKLFNISIDDNYTINSNITFTKDSIIYNIDIFNTYFYYIKFNNNKKLLCNHSNNRCLTIDSESKNKIILNKNNDNEIILYKN
ncbi:MAG: hypothetical protein LBV23_05225 [Deltaproteobacteria bacterium]|jgi:hypothetical protein|nr:hypothetical protein [Deltaproteobacteria bacterium]